MLTLASTETLQGKATEATKVTCTIVGDQVTSGASVFKVLEQKQVSNVAGVLYESPSGKESLISQIFLVNSGAEQTVELFIAGTAAANQIARLKIPVEGSATLDGHGWQVYDKSGKSIFLQGTAGEGLELTGSNEFKIKAAGVTNAMLAGEIEGTKLKAKAITVTQIAANAVEEEQIKALAVAEGKLAEAVQRKLLGTANPEAKKEETGAEKEFIPSATKAAVVVVSFKAKAATEVNYTIEVGGTVVSVFKKGATDLAEEGPLGTFYVPTGAKLKFKKTTGELEKIFISVVLMN